MDFCYHSEKWSIYGIISFNFFTYTVAEIFKSYFYPYIISTTYFANNNHFPDTLCVYLRSICNISPISKSVGKSRWEKFVVDGCSWRKDVENISEKMDYILQYNCYKFPT